MEQKEGLNYYRLKADDVIAQLRSNAEGLSDQEAHERLEHLGRNELQHTKKAWFGVIFIRQFKNLLVLLLLISATLALIVLQDRKTAIILFVIALINAIVGFVQEYKAESLMTNLEKLVVPKAKVLRSNELKEIDSTEIVLGDIVYIEEGDSIPADLRIIDEDELSTNDFALTGESNPSRKFVHAISANVSLPNRHNLGFMGTTVATGRAHGIVIATAMNTELGRIANLSQSSKSDESPLQKEMSHLAKQLVKGTAVLAAILTLIALEVHFGVHDAILFAIGIAAAMIPNGLAAEVSVTLAQTAGRMAKAKTLVKKLSAVETLGATSIIATDKTGTLTKNEMTAVEFLVGKTAYTVTGTGYAASGSILDNQRKKMLKKQLKDMELFFTTCVLASNATVHPPDNEHGSCYVVGDPTEGALITLSRKAGFNPEKITNEYAELKEYAFDAARKRMSSVRTWKNQEVAFVKGAPESILSECVELWDHGHIRKLTQKDRDYFNAYNEDQAKKAMRNLAVAYRILPKSYDVKSCKSEDIEEKLIFLGIVSIVDPLRNEVPAAMEAARAAHIKVAVITGDYPTTAEAIARKAKLVDKDEKINIITSDELRGLADSQILQIIDEGGAVFSRATPEDKLRIVNILKHHKQVVAVTGDGINDAPALKRADIGVAMGATGTDVAKEAADIVLLDDSFHTLVKAIQQGRVTYQNISKAARCALTANAGELVTVLISLAAQAIFNIPIAITAIQVLAIDVIAEIFPVTALGWDPPESDLMSEAPRNLKDHIVNKNSIRTFILSGLLAATIAYSNFIWLFWRNGASPVHFSTNSSLYARATILTYLTLVLCQFINLLMVRSSNSNKFFTNYLWSNKKLIIAFGFSLFCIINIIYNPLIQPFFGASSLTFLDWMTAGLGALIYAVIMLFIRHNKKHTRKAVLDLHRQFATTTNS